MKTLYVRVVLTFLAVIVFSVLSSVLLSLALFQKQLNETGRNEMLAAGDRIIRVYEQTSPPDLDGFLDSMAALGSYRVQLFDGSGGMKAFGSEPNKTSKIGPETVRKVLDGEPYRSTAQDNETFVGLPFASGGERYALFVLSSDRNEAAILHLIATILLLVLVIGGLCIFVAARLLVKPLKVMTQATKRLGKGDFNVELKMNRRDELGTLAQSINEMAREIKQMEQMRQDFVSNVSHEIQSPLTSISGFAKALMDDSLIPESERSQYLDIIAKESERLSRLSDNLLKLASLESEHHPFETATFNLDEQIRRIIVACEPLWSAKNIRVALMPLPSPCTITADPDQLNQVWINVLGNSIKFTPRNGHIRIGITRPDRDAYTVTIADSGIGISPEDASRIFERFYTSDRSRNRNSGGSGLGLAIVKKIVALHHGSIEVKSEVGQGTAIAVTLPAVPPEQIR
ncbi:ATP-binding protein [Paenibacillus sp. GCM10027626]|uniref:HAMP domain-containing sensor histidine kinase n=1 Tax=Paenibacillus sp. GCM10027626 TaxID=3273411 RepID=UPI0036286F75